MSTRRQAAAEHAAAEGQDIALATAQPAVEPEPADEVGSLARELGRAYGELVTAHKRSWGIETPEAIEKARTPSERALEMAATDPPEELSWHTLTSAMEHDPGAVLAAWERVKAAARDELRSGHRTAASLEWSNRPWDRARYLALRESLWADWQPRGSVEVMLVDLLAHTFTLYLQWSERLTLYAVSECEAEDVKLKKEGYWLPPRMSQANWMKWCAEQAESSHRRFLMTTKMLQDLRRVSGVTIASAGQVNLGQQQLILAAREPGDR